MPTPSPEIIQLLSHFASAFSVPTFAHVLVLVYGVILAPGGRTVSSALRAQGRGDDPHFTTYHRVLNRAQWSPWVLSEILLGLIILIGLPSGAGLILLIDETLERRRGQQIKNKGWWRDPLRSTLTQVSDVLGIRWICMAVVVPLPWSQRPWALPFLLIPARSPKTSAKLGKRHRTLVEWAEVMISRVRRWQPERGITLVGDGS